jgi:hypothetical protein
VNLCKGLVLDANILLRAVFGSRVRQLLETYEDVAGFYSPDVCFEEAQEYIPDVAKRRRVDSSLAVSVLEQVRGMVVAVDRSLYESHEKLARERIPASGPGRLAGGGSCAAVRRTRVDGGSGFFRKRNSDLDYGSSGVIPARLCVER